MRVIIVLCLLELTIAAPPTRVTDDRETKILRYENHNTGFGPYKYSFEQSDGTKAEQEGELVNKGFGEYLNVRGSFTFISTNGVRYTVTYTANDDGFKPEIEEGPGGIDPTVLNSMLG